MSLTIINASQNYYVRGGSDRYFFALSDLLADAGHRVIPFSSVQPQNEPTPWKEYFPPGVRFESPGLGDLARFVYSPAAASAMTRLIADEQPDLAHLHIYYGQLTGAILGPLWRAGVPVVQTLHDFKLVCPVYSLMSHGRICEACQGHQFWRAALRRCNRGSLARSVLSTVESYTTRWLGAIDRVAHFIAVSHFQRRKMIELGVPAEKITTVHNFFDTTRLAPTVTRGEHFLYFGRLERLKGVFTLVAAAEAVRDVPLLIAGTGPARAELEAIIRDRKLSHVHLVGFQQGDDLARLIRGSIATILPSEGYDNCPMAILESYGYARPVIGADMGGIPELIEDEVDGYIVPPGDADALAQRMTTLAADGERSVEMGLRGRTRIEERFSAQVHYENVLAVYRRVLPSLLVERLIPPSPALAAADSQVDGP